MTNESSATAVHSTMHRIYLCLRFHLWCFIFIRLISFISIDESKVQYANHIGKLMIQVYNDAKRLGLTAYSWPSRHVSGQASNEFSFNEKEPNEHFVTIRKSERPFRANVKYSDQWKIENPTKN